MFLSHYVHKIVLAVAACAMISAAKPKVGLPSAILLVDEATHDVFVLPPESVKPSAPSGYYHIRPATILRASVPAEKANATDTPLAERVTHFASVAQKKLGTLRLDAAWGESVINFVTASGNLAANISTPKTPWPPLVNFSASTLQNQNGQIFVFTVREAGKLGILDKVDFVYLDATGKVTRSYWSRALNDPTAAENAVNAIDKVATQFQKNMRAESLAYDESKIRVVFDKRIGERDVLTTETALKGSLSAPPDAMLIPLEITQTEVRYQTPLSVANFAAFAKRLKELDARLTAVRQDETNIVTIQVQGLQ